MTSFSEKTGFANWLSGYDEKQALLSAAASGGQGRAIRPFEAAISSPTCKKTVAVEDVANAMLRVLPTTTDDNISVSRSDESEVIDLSADDDESWLTGNESAASLSSHPSITGDESVQNELDAVAPKLCSHSTTWASEESLFCEYQKVLANAKVSREQFVPVHYRRAPIDALYMLEPVARGQTVLGPFIQITHRGTGQQFLLHRLPKCNEQKTLRLRYLIAKLKRLDHPSLAKVIEIIDSPSFVDVVFEECPEFSASDLQLRHHGRLPRRLTRRLIVELLRGIAYLHASGHALRNLSLDSFTISKSGREVKIVDFGACTLSAQPQTGQIFHGGSTAPEALWGSVSAADVRAADVWALGVIFCQLTTGYTPPPGNMETPDADAVAGPRDKVCPRLPAFALDSLARFGRSAEDLLRRLLDPDPASRPTAPQALNHPYCRRLPPDAYFEQQRRRRRRGQPGLTPSEALRRVKSFARCTLLERALRTVVAHYLPREAVADLYELFVQIDESNTGIIDLEILLKFLTQTIRGDRPMRALPLAAVLDGDGSGVVEFTEFAAALMQPADYLRWPLALQAAFQLCSRGKRRIVLKDLIDVRHGLLRPADHICATSELITSPQAFQLLFDQLDIDGDNGLGFQEFVTAVTKSH